MGMILIKSDLLSVQTKVRNAINIAIDSIDNSSSLSSCSFTGPMELSFGTFGGRLVYAQFDFMTTISAQI